MLSSDLMSGNGEAFKFLARGFLYPEDEEFVKLGWNVLRGLSRDLCIPFDHTTLSPRVETLQAEYVRLFISSPTGQLTPPYASCYISRSRLLNQEGAQEALSFYQEVGVEPESGIEPPDHIATELAFCAHLIDLKEYSLLIRFLEQHLLKWYPSFLTCLLASNPSAWYRQLGQVAGAMLEKIHEKGGV